MLPELPTPDAVSTPESLGPEPRRRVAVLTCMDARIDPLRLLGLELGDAHIVRNAGGLVTDDAIRSLSASQRLLGTRKIVVIMHRNCGLQQTTDEDFRAMLEADGVKPAWRLGAFESLEETLQAGLKRLRESPELPYRDGLRGMIFDPATGSVEELDRQLTAG
jgi:carbonic anhydrase